MKLEQSFTVAAPVDRVWEALIDVQRVAPCLPGAEIDEVGDDGSYKGTFTVKLGPTTAAYNGTLKLEQVDEAAHTVVMSARGTDKRGQGAATATIRSTVRAGEDGTTVDVDTDFTITGRLARFGRGGMIEDVSKRLMRDFSSCLQAGLAGDPEPRRASTTAPGPASDAPAPDAPAPDAPAPAPPRPAAKPVNGLRLLLDVLLDRIKRLVSRRS